MHLWFGLRFQYFLCSVQNIGLSKLVRLLLLLHLLLIKLVRNKFWPNLHKIFHWPRKVVKKPFVLWPKYEENRVTLFKQGRENGKVLRQRTLLTVVPYCESVPTLSVIMIHDKPILEFRRPRFYRFLQSQTLNFPSKYEQSHRRQLWLLGFAPVTIFGGSLLKPDNPFLESWQSYFLFRKSSLQLFRNRRWILL